jgi:hypothetical protein
LVDEYPVKADDDVSFLSRILLEESENLMNKEGAAAGPAGSGRRGRTAPDKEFIDKYWTGAQP